VQPRAGAPPREGPGRAPRHVATEVASTRDPLPGDDGARLEGLAPVGGVLIGAETFERLPDGAVASHGPACA
jgi:hypothetical protein